MHRVFFSIYKYCNDMTSQILEGILEYMKNVMNNLAKDAFENLEIGGIKEIENFLQNQFDVRLENLLGQKIAVLVI